MTEDQLEQEALGWLAEVGYSPIYGPNLAPDGNSPERSSYLQVVLVERLRSAIARLNPAIPFAAREDALQQVLTSRGRNIHACRTLSCLSMAYRWCCWS
jgi:type I restriction enzyme R subunit